MDFKFIPDLPIDSKFDDALGFNDFIEVLQSSIQKTETPFVYGVLGNWGAGKTSILRLLNNRIEQELQNGYSYSIPIWFNAWEYENESNLIYPLFNSIKRDYKTRLKVKELSDNFTTQFLNVISSSTLALGDIGIRIITKALTGEAIKIEDIEKHIKSVKDHSNEIENALNAWTDQIYTLKKNFELLLDAYANDYPFETQEAKDDARFVILIDDLDRCLPETVIAILERIKNFLSVKRCIFVLALNPKIVYQGIKVKYNGLEINGREYLEKILNYSFYVPEPEVKSIEQYCERSLEKLVGNDGKKIFSEQLDRFGKTLGDCNFNNPRKIKRILNHYLFFLKINEKELDHYHLPNIIRLIILAEYYPSIFEILLESNSGSKNADALLLPDSLGSIMLPRESKNSISQEINRIEVSQIRKLLDLVIPESRNIARLDEHVTSVFRIVRLS